MVTVCFIFVLCMPTNSSVSSGKGVRSGRLLWSKNG